MNIYRIRELIDKTNETLKYEGFSTFVSKAKTTVKNRINRKKDSLTHEYVDVLFINGCSLPHPQRYRVDHQIEQLEAAGLSCKKIYYTGVSVLDVKYARAIVIYRCSIIPSIKDIIELAHENNKIVFYDIDDLVFDSNDVKNLDVLKNMTKKEKDTYLDGVKRMGETLKLCDYGIASTTRLKIEMEKHLKEVFVNRNVASEEMIECSKQALKLEKENDKIIIGYLSGSITHNEDFNLIKSSLIKVIKKYDNVYLKIGGFVDLPDDMKEIKDKIITTSFVNYKKLPEVIHSLDINIAPLENTIFNEAKSENKWTEAALVKVPTIASNVGAFKETIKNGKTGFLAKDNEWEKYLELLIEDEKLRKQIGQNAYDEVMKNHCTLSHQSELKDFILSKLNKNIFFVLPSTNISGGILVATKHAQILKKNGYDVTLLNAQNDDNNIVNKDGEVIVIPACMTNFKNYVDTIVATMWLTLEFAIKFSNKGKVKYLVQGYETDFYKSNDFHRILCEATYNMPNVEYITISKWCESWLKEKYGQKPLYAPNGLDLDLFKYKKRTFKGKIKILVEGNSKDYLKNVDESFKIVDKLDKDKFEISYLSYEQEPKDTYYVDNFYHKIPHDEVGKIYQENDILIKTSLLESFSYPPLEMMSTGGITVAIQNCGNKEFMKNNYNCLIYNEGNIDEAVEKINSICEDKSLREKLIENGLKTAKERDWTNIEKEVLKLYD